MFPCVIVKNEKTREICILEIRIFSPRNHVIYHEEQLQLFSIIPIDKTQVFTQGFSASLVTKSHKYLKRLAAKYCRFL